MLFLTHERPWILVVYVVFGGFGMEVEQAMFPPMVADLFPGQSLGRIMGVLSASSGLGASFGSWLGGYLYDLTVEDTFALLCALAATLAAVAFVWAAAPCKAQEMCTKG